MTLPRRRNRTPAVLVLAPLAGLVAMHGLSGTALVGPAHQVMPVAVISIDMAVGLPAHAALPAGPARGGHYGPAASGHHPCVAAPAAGVALARPGPLTRRRQHSHCRDEPMWDLHPPGPTPTARPPT